MKTISNTDPRLLMMIIILLTTLGSRAFSQNIFEAANNGNLALTKQIIEENPGVLDYWTSDGWTILHYSSRWIDKNQMEIVKLLLDKGADINASVQESGSTPLHLALQDRNEPLAKFYISKGARVDIRDDRGRLPLYDALAINANGVIDQILAGDSGIDIEKDGNHLIHAAAKNGYSELVDMLIQGATDVKSLNSIGRTLMHNAAVGGLVDLMRTLVAKGVNTNMNDAYGQEPIHLAAKEGQLLPLEFLIDNGVDIDTKDPMGKTALHLAQESGHTQAADFLIKNGANQASWVFDRINAPYIDQASSGEVPRLFAPGIISTEEGFEYAISFHPEGKELLLSKRIYGGPNHLVSMKYENNHWSAPKRPFFGSDFRENEAIFSPDGRYLIFHSRRPVPGTTEENRNTWILDYSSPDPEPRLLYEPSKTPEFLMYVSSTINNKIYFTGNGGIHAAGKTETGYEEATFLEGDINTPTQGTHPFIAPDESYLIFDSSNRPDSFGESDLYVSFKNEDGSWSSAINMGDKINSKGYEMCASVSGDGKYLFFHSDKNGNGDMYWVNTSVINELRPKN